MADFIGQFVEWKDWNIKLLTLNKLNKSRYYEKIYYTLKEPDDALFEDHLFPCKGDDYYSVYFAAKKEKVTGFKTRHGFKSESYNDNDPTCEGWKTYVRVALFEKTGDELNADCRCADQSDAIFDEFNVDGEYLNHWYAIKPKYSTIPKEMQDWRDARAIHKDRYGVLIDIGDYIAFSAKDSQFATIQKVEKITENKVNNAPPSIVTVVRSADPNKKLGW